MNWDIATNNAFQKEWDEFKDHHSTEGYNLKYVFEIYLPFWQCKQNIIVDKELRMDTFSKILLELIKDCYSSHTEICEFLGLEEDNYHIMQMQLNFLIKNNLIRDKSDGYYEITHEGLAFLENRAKPRIMEMEEFDYMAKEKYSFLENDMTNNFFDPSRPIDKNLSKLKKMDFSGYDILQTHQIKKEQGKIYIKHTNNPTYRKVIEKRNDFAEFFAAMNPNKFFYDFADNEFESHKRSICFLGFWYENKDNADDRKIDIRQFENSVNEFKNYEFEIELSKKVTDYVLKNDIRAGKNAEIDTEIQKDESPKEIQKDAEQNEFKFCSECGKKLKITAKFCTQCGTKQDMEVKQ